MVEVTFKVNKDSDFYKQYFASKKEKQKFHDYAREFFLKYDLIDSSNYYLAEFLGMQLTSEQKKRFEGQIKKYDDYNGMTLFKKRSAMQKEWTDNVVNKVDMSVLNSCRFWYFPYISSGSYNLWDKDGEVYGHLTDKYKEEIKLSDDMIPIKMSEYYAVFESLDD